MRTCLILSLALVACSDAPAQQVPPETDPARAHFEQVAAALMAGDYHLEQARTGAGLNEIERYYDATGDPEAIALMLRFAARWPREAGFSVASLAQVRADTLGSLVEAPPAWWGEGEWYVLAANLIGECREPEGCWREERVVEALLERTLAAETEVGTRDAMLKAFAAMGTLDEARALTAYVRAAPPQSLNESVYGVLARYDTPELTGLLRRQLAREDLTLMSWVARDGLGRYGRHDLLPELRRMLAQAHADATADRQAARVREIVPGVIADLEAAQAAGVVPGLPLDWPATPDDYEAPR